MSGYPKPPYGDGSFRPHVYQASGTTNSSLQSSSVRSNQISAMRRSIPECRPRNASETEWELPVLTHDQVPVHVRITVPPSYPEEPPVLRVNEFKGLNHVWVDDKTGSMTLHCLANWPAVKATLTDVVESAFEALSGRSYAQYQQQLAAPDYPAARMYDSGGASTSWGRPPGGGAPAGAGGAPGRAGGVQRPADAPAAARAKLQGLSTAQLEGLVLDAAEFAAFLQPFVAESAAGRRVLALQAETAALARENIAMKQEYDNTHQQVQITRAAELGPAETHYNDLMARQMAVISKLDPSSVLTALRDECDGLETEAAALEGEFLSHASSDAKAAAFASQFVEHRKRFHTLNIKLEAARELIAQR